MIGRIFHRPYPNHQPTLNTICLNMIIVIPINNVKLQTIIHIINTLKKSSFLHIIYHFCLSLMSHIAFSYKRPISFVTSLTNLANELESDNPRSTVKHIGS